MAGDQLRRHHDARYRRTEAGERIDPDFHLLHFDAGKLRGAFVIADGVDLATEGQTTGDIGDYQRQHDHHPDGVGQTEQRSGADAVEAGIAEQRVAL